jgi:glutaredoxin-like protein NrdH
MVEITVYGKPRCYRCDATKRELDKHGLEFSYVDVLQDDTSLAVVRHLGYSEMPVVLVGDMHWGGFRADKIEQLAKILNSEEWQKRQTISYELDAIEYLREELGWKT